MWNSIPGCWNHDLNRRQLLNQLSHPGIPSIIKDLKLHWHAKKGTQTNISSWQHRAVIIGVTGTDNEVVCVGWGWWHRRRCSASSPPVAHLSSSRKLPTALTCHNHHMGDAATPRSQSCPQPLAECTQLYSGTPVSSTQTWNSPVCQKAPGFLLLLPKLHWPKAFMRNAECYVMNG